MWKNPRTRGCKKSTQRKSAICLIICILYAGWRNIQQRNGAWPPRCARHSPRGHLTGNGSGMPLFRLHTSADLFIFFLIFLMYDIQHCFICCPSDSTVYRRMLGSNPRTVATTALALRRSNQCFGSVFIFYGSGSRGSGWRPTRTRIQYGSRALMTKNWKK
jgi:hypothetical protein